MADKYTEFLNLRKEDFTTENGRDVLVRDTMKHLMGEHNSQSNLDILDNAYSSINAEIQRIDAGISDLHGEFNTLRDVVENKTNVFTLYPSLQQIVDDIEYYEVSSDEIREYKDNMVFLIAMPQTNGGEARLRVNRLSELNLKKVNYHYHGLEELSASDIKEGIFYFFKILGDNLVLVSDSIYKANKDGTLQVNLNSHYLGGVDLEGIQEKINTDLQEHNDRADAHANMRKTLPTHHVEHDEPFGFKAGDTWAKVVRNNGDQKDVQLQYKNTVTGIVETHYPITTIDNVQRLAEALNGVRDFVDTHNLDTAAHPSLVNKMSALESKLDRLEEMILYNIKGNAYSITFGNLDMVNVEGVWNASLNRIEF